MRKRQSIAGPAAPCRCCDVGPLLLLGPVCCLEQLLDARVVLKVPARVVDDVLVELLHAHSRYHRTKLLRLCIEEKVFCAVRRFWATKLYGLYLKVGLRIFHHLRDVIGLPIVRSFFA